MTHFNKSNSAADRNLVWHSHAITRIHREKQNGHSGAVIWLTGLPSSGKSTIAHAVEKKLNHLGVQTIVLDGDNMRHGLCADLGFSTDDRNENVRRVGEVAKILLERGMVVFVALVSPIRNAREKVRESMSTEDFLEIYCRCDANICKQRDPKGMYNKAVDGKIKEFTGVSSAYEAPVDANLILDTENESIDESVELLTKYLVDKLKIIKS